MKCMNTIIEKTVTKPVLLQVFYFELDREGIKGREDGRGWGDYSREAIILNILVKMGRLFEGRLLFEEYMDFNYSKNP